MTFPDRLSNNEDDMQLFLKEWLLAGCTLSVMPEKVSQKDLNTIVDMARAAGLFVRGPYEYLKYDMAFTFISRRGSESHGLIIAEGTETVADNPNSVLYRLSDSTWTLRKKYGELP